MSPVKHQLLESPEQWSDLKNQAAGSRELVVLKFSPICPISARAERQFDEWSAGLPEEAGLALAKVDVIGARPLSQALAAELDVTHQSPQVLWLDAAGAVKWHASHDDINVASLEARR